MPVREPLVSSPLEVEALKAIDVVLAYWDQEYFSLASQETGFRPLLPRVCDPPTGRASLVTTADSVATTEASVSESQTSEQQQQLQTPLHPSTSSSVKESLSDKSRASLTADAATERPSSIQPTTERIEDAVESTSVEAADVPETDNKQDADESAAPNPVSVEESPLETSNKNEVLLSTVTESSDQPLLAETSPRPHVSPPRTPLDKFDYSYRAGKGGKGWWKYLTKPRGSDAKTQQAQFLTLWFTPTPKAPIPRATAGVWFVYEKLDEAKSKAFTKVMHMQLNEKGKSTTGITQVATISYRFEHSHLTHDIAVPSNLSYLPLLLADENPNSSEARLGAPYLRIPELVSSSLIVSEMVESGKHLKEMSKKVGSDADAALDDPPITGAGIQLKVNGNGIPLEVIQELARTENYPVLTSKEVIMRHHLGPAKMAKIPLDDQELYARISEQHQVVELERARVVEARRQARITKRL
ncbi:hypothetical protein BDR26DRAFT_1003465 [Obelidium mucronatum]|nr:hypothetical protein BDR26DRAFT_1003465 [Obelidium mucronatum]